MLSTLHCEFFFRQLALQCVASYLCSLESGAMVLHSSQARISSHRVGLSPKPLPFSQGSQNIQSEVTHQINRQAEEEVSAARSISKSSKVSLASNLQQYPSRKVTAWTSLDASADQVRFHGSSCSGCLAQFRNNDMCLLSTLSY